MAEQLGELADASLQPWLDAGLDPDGGAYGFLDREFRPIFDDETSPGGPSGEVRGDQSLVQQARHLFSYSFMEEMRPGDPRLSEFADAMYEHLQKNFFNKKKGLYLNQITRDKKPRSDAVQLYAQAFVVYALVTYGQAFFRSEVSDQARALFLTLDQMRHDETHGGFDQKKEEDWFSYVEAPKGAVKCTNTHIHLLEALIPLCRAFPEDELIVSRLAELAELVSTKLVQPSGYLHPFFSADWKPVGPGVVSFGHDLETSWLLIDALDALVLADGVNEQSCEQIESASSKIAQYALGHGWDPAGGFFESGVPEGQKKAASVKSREKIWWVQAEALPGIYSLYRTTRRPELVDRLEKTLTFLQDKLWDPQHGGFFCGVDSEGKLGPRGDHKGEIWKTPYHTVRAFLLTSEWIQQDVAFG